jgi:hypothetical protein
VLRSADTSPEAIAARLEAAGIHLSSCSVVEPSLEDVFLDVAEKAAA